MTVTRDSDQPGPPGGAGTRRQLLAAAQSVFAARGEAARLEEVAAAAGLTKSTVFRHWPTKDALVAEVRLRGAERYRGWVEHACRSNEASPLAGVAEAAVGFFGRSRQALFDPLVTRDAIDDGAPEIDALDAVLTECVARVAPSGAASDVRALLDSLVIATTRGWLGTPDLAELDVDPLVLRGLLEIFVRGGLDGIGPLPVTGRRPRRPSRGVIDPAASARDRREAELLNAAVDGFAAAGYQNATLEDIAQRAGTTASALFVYWPSKEELFLRVRQEAQARIASRILEAIEHGPTAEARLRAAIHANIAAHYDHPEYQAIMLPVASLPDAVELETVGWNRTIEQLQIIPALDRVGDVLPVITAIGLTVLRMAVLTMHRRAIHPALVTAMAEGYLVGGIGSLAATLGVALDQPIAGATSEAAPTRR
jgi:AcrR family transcriptional regulator